MMKVLGTMTFPPSEVVEGLRKLGAQKNECQFRTVVLCKGLKHANRKSRLRGFLKDPFSAGYTAPTGNPKEIEVTQDGDIWFDINDGFQVYVSLTQALAAVGKKPQKHSVQIIDNSDIKNNYENKYPHLWKEVMDQDRISNSSWYNLSADAYEEWEKWVKGWYK